MLTDLLWKKPFNIVSLDFGTNDHVFYCLSCIAAGRRMFVTFAVFPSLQFALQH